MGISFKSSFRASEKIAEIKDRNKKNLGVAMSDAKVGLLIDISQGKGVEGAMPGYSPKYKKFKQKLGRSGNVDLRRTGKMLTAMQITVEELGEKLIGKIYFLAGERDKAKWNQRLRYFFGLSQQQLQKLKRKLNVK